MQQEKLQNKKKKSFFFTFDIMIYQSIISQKHTSCNEFTEPTLGE